MTSPESTKLRGDYSVRELAKQVERPVTGVLSTLKKLGFEDDDPTTILPPLFVACLRERLKGNL